MSSAVTGFCRIDSELVEVIEYRTRSTVRLEGSLRKFEGLLFSERPLDEPVPLFPAGERLYGGGQTGD